MAASDYRIVRRRRGSSLTAAVPAPNSLVAASAPVASARDVFKASTVIGGGGRDSWQDEAWELFDLVGELGCYVRWRARSCSRVKLIASEIDPETGQPTGSIREDDEQGRKVAAIVRSIAGGPLGQAEFIEHAVTILSVPGEFFTAILITPEGERWLALSKQQIKASQKNRDSVTIMLPEGGEHEYNPANGDGMFRVWNPHPKIPTQATSPVQANLSPLREIVRTTNKIENADNSRLANNGLLVIPLEASLPSGQGPVADGKPGGTAAGAQPSASRSLQRMIVEANEIGAKDHRSHAAVTPIVVGAPAEHLDKIRHVDIGKDVADIEIKKRDSAMLRFARGIDMEPDQLLGLGDTNHWNGHLLADQDVNLHVNPVMKTLCHAFWRNVVRPMLVKAKIADPDKYVLWFDASDLTADPDLTDEAKDANAVGALTNTALLKHLRLPDDDGYKLDSIEGLKQLALDKIAQAAPTEFIAVIKESLPLLDPSLQGIRFPEPVAALPHAVDPDDHGDDPEEVPVDGTPPETEGKAPRRPVTAAVADERVSIAADSYLMRALELAGKRRVKTYDHDQRARLASRPAHEWHQSLPPVQVSDVGRLIASYDAGLDDLAGKYGFDADAVRAFVVGEARRRLTSQVVDA